MKKAILPLVILTSLLASCGTQSIPSNSATLPATFTSANTGEKVEIAPETLACMETAKPGDSCTDKSTPVNLATIVFPKEVDGKFGSLATGNYVIKNMPVGQIYTKFFYLRTDQAKETWSKTSQNNFNVVVEASGNIRVVEVKGSGSYQYQAGFTATGAKCQDTQVWKREYYLDFQQYKVYADGSTVLIPNSRFAVLQKFELVRKDSPTPPWYKC